MDKKIIIIVFLIALLLLGCSPKEKPQEPSYSGGGCGVAQNGDYFISPESANFFGLSISREDLDLYIESSCIRKGYDGLLGWRLVKIQDLYLTIDYFCCKNAMGKF